jgi:hypothetical protein
MEGEKLTAEELEKVFIELRDKPLASLWKLIQLAEQEIDELKELE